MRCRGHRVQNAILWLPLVALLGCSDSVEEPSQSQAPEAADYQKGTPEHIRQVTAAIDADALRNADENQGDWLTYGRNYQEDRYSELDQISKDNLDQLGLAWTIDLGTKRGIQATPLVVDGIMFLSGPWSVVYAVDVRKGELIWTYDPQVDRDRAPIFCCGVVNRGLAIYKGAIFIGTLDGRLVSIDAATGTKNWESLTIDLESDLSITGAPRIADGKVLIGNGGSEYTARGYVSAYDAETGELAWRFYTVPGNPAEPFEHPDLEDAAKTWTGEWWKLGGGGTAWDAITHDPELNLVYIGVGNGSPWNRLRRSPDGGDNLYLSSIVAVNASTGEYVWHYQTTPGDTWDYTATQHILQADIEIDGALRKVLMQAPKNGFFYVIDRETGEFIDAEPFAYVSWAEGIDDNGRPIEAEGARYEDGRQHWIAPSSFGAHNWMPMSYNRKTGLVYIPAVEQIGSYMYEPHLPNFSRELANGGNGGTTSTGYRLYADTVHDTNPAAPKPGKEYGRLIAYDPVKQSLVWEVKQPWFYNSGLLTTSNGLLFQGDAEGMFSVRDIDNGKALWQFDVRSGAIGSPITYLVDGEQYVTIAVGWGGGRGQATKLVDRVHPGTIYTFKLGGNAPAPEKLPPIERPLVALTTEAEPVDIGRGWNLYVQHCATCHGRPGTGGGALPDLARSSEGIYQILDQIVLQGVFASQGMPNFGDKLSADELQQIKDYLLYTAEAFRTGVDPAEYNAKLAEMQRLADLPLLKGG